ncbi:heterokaryon incompatibility protein-domain-containing protein [Triangularia verruculosa]|uniref:Heterokaryon incompatibility protein-domain-containing protein n=1 Tax=Triangularia verruculosa TaxID=2587418 RepID=A0AAN6XCQ0_9PEZI|nr:heterokaryon incompatibility protein-domain-containing protein [Triangularia verruculosa]
MRLINASSLQLEWFMDHEQAPPYAILSHTWGDGEVTLQDFTSADRSAARSLAGFAKIELTCHQALKDGLSHAWVDTCCIDKTSSAELSEAINSMYEWYKHSAICYAFLEDLSADEPLTSGDDTSCTGFTKCRWFSRGWTLQELIAPETVQFYDADWNLRGTKASLAHLLTAITRIEESVLRGETDIFTLPVASRMAWAADRVTSRVEDIAYSLLGIFSVNMAMLYGEGRRAFIRLQEEILRESNDTSIFAWKATGGSKTQRLRGILAESPSEFAYAVGIKMTSDPRFDNEFAITNKGVRVEASTVIMGGRSILPLNCTLDGKVLGLYIVQYGSRLYARDRPELMATQGDGQDWTAQWENTSSLPIYVSKTLSPALSATLEIAHRHGIHLRHGFAFSAQVGPNGRKFSDPLGTAIGVVSWIHPMHRWDMSRQLFLTKQGEDFTALIMFGNEEMLGVLLAVGVADEEPWVSFIDAAEWRDKVSSHDQWDLREAKRIGMELQASKSKSAALRITKDTLDGELVYCIDMVETAYEEPLLAIESPLLEGLFLE